MASYEKFKDEVGAIYFPCVYPDCNSRFVCFSMLIFCWKRKIRNSHYLDFSLNFSELLHCLSFLFKISVKSKTACVLDSFAHINRPILDRKPYSQWQIFTENIDSWLRQAWLEICINFFLPNLYFSIQTISQPSLNSRRYLWNARDMKQI